LGLVHAQGQNVPAARSGLVDDVDHGEDGTGTQIERLGQLDPRRDGAFAAVPASGGEFRRWQRRDKCGRCREGRQILIITCLTTV
jgi:hypothetical protein